MALRENLAGWSLTPFESQYHMMEAIRDPQYSKVPEYRAAVEAKICLDAKGVHTTVYAPPDLQRNDSGIGERQTETGQARAQDQKSAEELHREIFGERSVAPTPLQNTQRDRSADIWERHFQD
jgi:hypothetical protein